MQLRVLVISTNATNGNSHNSSNSCNFTYLTLHNTAHTTKHRFKSLVSIPSVITVWRWMEIEKVEKVLDHPPGWWPIDFLLKMTLSEYLTPKEPAGPCQNISIMIPHCVVALCAALVVVFQQFSIMLVITRKIFKRGEEYKSLSFRAFIVLWWKGYLNFHEPKVQSPILKNPLGAYLTLQSGH